MFMNFHTVGLKKDGTVVAVGLNDQGQCNVTTWKDIVQVSGGYDNTVALKADGICVAVGGNSQGQCDIQNWINIKQISCGEYHTVGLKKNGTCVATGNNNSSQCNVTSWTDIVQISCGNYHTVGLKKDGTCVAVGRNNENQLNVTGWNNITSFMGDFPIITPLPKFLLKQNNQYYSIKGNELVLLKSQVLSKDNFNINGIEVLKLLTQENIFYEETKQNENNVFEYNLNKEIAKIEMI